MRVTSDLWVGAYRRRCNAELIQLTILQKGAAEAGAIYIKLYDQAGKAMILAPITMGIDQADRQWMFVHGEQPVAESVADQYLRGVCEDDRDAWVIEIEDPQMRSLLDDGIISLD